MRVADAMMLVGRSVRSSPLRSLLTALGIAIGIAAVTLLTSIGAGVHQYVLEQFTQFGTRIIAIQPGKTSTQGMGGILSTTRPLTIADAHSLRNLPGVTSVLPVVQGTGEISTGPRTRASEIIGVGTGMPDAWNFRVAQGRFLPDDDHPRPFVVLGQKMKQELFGNRPALGEWLQVGGMRFRVIGVMDSKGQMLGFDLDDVVYIAAEHALALFDRDSLMEIDVTFAPGHDPVSVSEAIRRTLVLRHGEEDFTRVTQDQMLESLDRILSVLTLSVAALGSISLLVGGVGILTIMTTTVRERTSEVGLLRALGSTQRQVMVLFLGEAIVLSVLGGLLGILSILALVGVLDWLAPNLPLQANWPYLGLSLLLSALVGLVAGVTPALETARLDPIEALRAE